MVNRRKERPLTKIKEIVETEETLRVGLKRTTYLVG